MLKREHHSRGCTSCEGYAEVRTDLANVCDEGWETFPNSKKENLTNAFARLEKALLTWHE
jgi:hypothetical protein